MEDLRERLLDLEARIQELEVRLDLAAKREEAARLETQAGDPAFWSDPEAARELMQRLAALKEELEWWDSLHRKVQETTELLDLAEEEDEALVRELAGEVSALERDLAQREFALLFSDPHDRDSAIFSIHAGAGGTEAQDWVAMLLRMYLRWAERKGFRTQILDSLDGEEAGLKTVTVRVEGPYAYGHLKCEKGVHRLVRLSPFDAAHRRHTSFALVEVMPDLEDDVEVEIDPKDLRIDVFRSSSAGGQNVQKNATAVRITHLPTGIVVSCQNERSQLQNKETALRILRARLYEMEQEKRRAELARLRGEHVEAGWGNQIRSYVLHPYQMVKDLRTGYETSNTEAVLDGEIDAFIEACLRAQVGEKEKVGTRRASREEG
ncbi:MAG: peptide chain release factor 2 [Anaerolineae bacterium]